MEIVFPTFSGSTASHAKYHLPLRALILPWGIFKSTGQQTSLCTTLKKSLGTAQAKMTGFFRLIKPRSHTTVEIQEVAVANAKFRATHLLGWTRR